MSRYLYTLLATASFCATVASASDCHHCKGLKGCSYGSYTPDGCPPYWCDPYACRDTWPMQNPYISGPRNWAWILPDGGFTAYPGQVGSGIRAYSDYSHVNWVAPPQVNAQNVVQKLDQLGIPRVPQDTIYLNRNPAQVNKAKLPMPKSWIQEPEAGKEIEKGKDGEADKAKEDNR